MSAIIVYADESNNFVCLEQIKTNFNEMNLIDYDTRDTIISYLQVGLYLIYMTYKYNDEIKSIGHSESNIYVYPVRIDVANHHHWKFMELLKVNYVMESLNYTPIGFGTSVIDIKSMRIDKVAPMCCSNSINDSNEDGKMDGKINDLSHTRFINQLLGIPLNSCATYKTYIYEENVRRVNISSSIEFKEDDDLIIVNHDQVFNNVDYNTLMPGDEMADNAVPDEIANAVPGGEIANAVSGGEIANAVPGDAVANTITSNDAAMPITNIVDDKCTRENNALKNKLEGNILTINIDICTRCFNEVNFCACLQSSFNNFDSILSKIKHKSIEINSSHARCSHFYKCIYTNYNGMHNYTEFYSWFDEAAKRILKIVFKNNGVIFGGYVRSMILNSYIIGNERRSTDDLDLLFSKQEDVENFLSECKNVGFHVRYRHNPKKSDGYPFDYQHCVISYKHNDEHYVKTDMIVSPKLISSDLEINACTFDGKEIKCHVDGRTFDDILHDLKNNILRFHPDAVRTIADNRQVYDKYIAERKTVYEDFMNKKDTSKGFGRRLRFDDLPIDGDQEDITDGGDHKDITDDGDHKDITDDGDQENITNDINRNRDSNDTKDKNKSEIKTNFGSYFARLSQRLHSHFKIDKYKILPEEVSEIVLYRISYHNYFSY